MKILFTYEFSFKKYGFGGGQVIALNFMNSLTRMGHSVSICCAGSDDGFFSKKSNYKFYFNNKKPNVFSSIQSAFHSIRIIKKIKPDLVCSFTGEAFAISYFCNKNDINFCTYIASPTLPYFSFKNPILSIKNIRYSLSHFFQYIGALQSKKNYSISEYTYKQLIDNWRVSEETIENLGCGVSDNFLKNNTNSPNRVIDICSVGRIEYFQKPINIAAKALYKSESWNKWVVIGSGSDEKKLKKLIRELGYYNKVEFFGSMENNEVQNILSNTKISLLLSNHESFFITAYEAIASNNILIVSDVAQIKEDFSEFPTVFILDNNSEKKIIELLDHILNNYYELYEKTGMAKEYIISKYSWNKISKKLIDPFLN